MLTVSESAKELGVSPKRVYKFISEGRISAQQRFGKLVIASSEIRRFRRLPRLSGRPVENDCKSTNGNRVGRKGGK